MLVVGALQAQTGPFVALALPMKLACFLRLPMSVVTSISDARSRLPRQGTRKNSCFNPKQLLYGLQGICKLNIREVLKSMRDLPMRILVLKR